MTSKTYTKHPHEVREITFDFTARLTKLGSTQAASEVVASKPEGLTVEQIASANGLVTVLVGGGDYGKAYKFGCQLLDNNGGIMIDLYTMRVQGPVIDAAFFDGNNDGFVDGNDD